MSAPPAAPNAQEVVRIAIPIHAGAFCEHFGTARQFHFYEGKRQHRLLAGVGRFDAPEHQPGSLPRWLAAQQVDLLVVSAIGERALIMLADAGVMVFLAGENQDPSALALSCLTGKLQRANGENSLCSGHHHDYGDGHACHQH